MTRRAPAARASEPTAQGCEVRGAGYRSCAALAPVADARFPAPLAAALTQAAAAAAACALLACGLEMTPGQWAVVQATIAMRIAFMAGAASWWIGLHVAFVPAAVLAQAAQIPPLGWAAAFAAALLIFGATYRTRVPLFLSAPAVRAALGALLHPDRSERVIDLGCGLGGVIAGLKRARPECECDGVELAWLPYLVSRLSAGRLGCRVQRRDLMAVDLSRYDLVYAFLSPAPMPQLWAKARREMRPGSRFVSCAFPVPEVAPERVVDVSGLERHRLYVWTM